MLNVKIFPLFLSRRWLVWQAEWWES